jgi:hypothetical protein
VTLAADGTVDCATVSLVDIIPSRSGVIQTVDHVSLVNVRKTFFFEDLNVKIFGAFQLGFEIGLASLSNVNVSDAVARRSVNVIFVRRRVVNVDNIVVAVVARKHLALVTPQTTF